MFFKLSSKRQNELNPVVRWKRFLDILPFRISSPHLFPDHLLGVSPLSVQGRHLLDRIRFYASQFGLKSVECVKKNLIFVFLWKVERESEKWKNRIKAAAQKKDGGTFLPWPPSILETMDSGHQRHCTPPKPLLRLTKNILKKNSSRKILRLSRQILTQHIIISFWWASFCIVVLLWTWGARCIGKYMSLCMSYPIFAWSNNIGV